MPLPRASVTTHSHYLREILLATGKYLAMIPISMLGVYNRNGVTVRRLRLDLGIKSTPMTLYTLRNRTLSPVSELFIECVRATARTIGSRGSQPSRRGGADFKRVMPVERKG